MHFKANINDTLMRRSDTSTTWRQFFANPVKPIWYITGPEGPLTGEHEFELVRCQAAANGCLSLSCGLCASMSPAERTGPLSVP